MPVTLSSDSFALPAYSLAFNLANSSDPAFLSIFRTSRFEVFRFEFNSSMFLLGRGASCRQCEVTMFGAFKTGSSDPYVKSRISYWIWKAIPEDLQNFCSPSKYLQLTPAMSDY